MKRNELISRLFVISICLATVAIPVSLYLSGRSDILHARMAENGGWTPQTIYAHAGQPVHLRITSDDVMHSFAIGRSDQPAVDIEPGKVTELSLTFERPGIYTFYCTRWCGLNHWRMRGTIEVSGDPVDPEAATEPLYMKLGLDIDAPHPAQVIPAQAPSASEGEELAAALPDLERLLSSDYYRSHSPAEAFSELAQAPLTDLQKWDAVAYLWRSNTNARQLEAGRQLFSQNCAACHGEQGGGDGVFSDDLAAAGTASTQHMEGAAGMSMQAPADFTDVEHMMGASPALLQGKMLRGGMGTGMPMWGTILTDEQTWSLVAYLYSLQFRY